MPDSQFIIICGIFYFAFLTQAATGFGAMILAMTLSAFFYPLDQLVVWFIPQVILLSSYILIRHHQHIAWALLLKQVLPAMLVGLGIGQIIFFNLNINGLKNLLGALVIVLAIKELLQRKTTAKPIALLPWTLSSGIVHGIFATGGPILVYGLNGQNLNKSVFRSSLAFIWLMLASVLLCSYFLTGKIASTDVPHIGILTAILPLSILSGEWLHNKINPSVFQKVIYGLLLFSGSALLIN